MSAQNVRQSSRHMRTRKRRPAPIRRDSSDNDDEWLVTYSDAITLLLAFFVVLINFSRIDLPVFDEIAAGLKSELGKRDVVSPISQLESSIEQVLSDLQISSEYTIKKDAFGLVTEFSTSALFNPANNQLTEEGRLMIDELILPTLRPGYENYRFFVESHVNPGSAPPQGFASNWLLTGYRAAAVMTMLEDTGIQSERLRALALADGSPAEKEVPEGVDPATVPEPDNDRIVIRIRPPVDERTAGRFRPQS